MNDLLKIATGELGVTEISGNVHSERILQYADDIGLSGSMTMKRLGAVSL